LVEATRGNTKVNKCIKANIESRGKKKKIIFVTTLALGLSPRQKACKGVGQK
jgi:hypothetical protein